MRSGPPLLFLFILLLPACTCIGQPLRAGEDLLSKCQALGDGVWAPYQGQQTRTVYFLVSPGAPHRFLQIASAQQFYLFVNNSLALHGVGARVDVDSLMRHYPDGLRMGIFQPDGIRDLQIHWLVPAEDDPLQNAIRVPAAFDNFVLIASLALLIFFTALFRTNPRLTLDYLDFVKLVNLRDREESQVTLRLTSSVNLLFYLFASLLAALAFLVAAHATLQGLTVIRRSFDLTTAQLVGRWLLTALAILGLLLLKLSLNALMARLFNAREIIAFQFFNFVRALMLSLAFIALVAVLCFSLAIPLNYFMMIKAGCWLLAFSTMLLYFKLLSRTGFRSFHLFSYLCGTEIFPLLILIKLLVF